MGISLNLRMNRNYISLHTAVVGSGAAGFAAALQLKNNGISDVAIITEEINAGTSRNTGSDKQTYYKLSMSGDNPDCPFEMAKDLFSGQSVDGDLAYAEAAGSAEALLHLVQLGVPFPTNRWGEYIGYRTDHDSHTRATSAGPLTSQMMTQCLEQAVLRAGVSIFDRYQVVQILCCSGSVCGLLALHQTGINDAEFVVFSCQNVIWATGGPAGCYADNVYPVSQHGSSGLAFEAGAHGKNLTEWQYGLASIQPKWNVSGTFMQVLPRVVSVDASGAEREFLIDHYQDMGRCLSMLFQKGYEWPFDSRKAHNGSSVIDLLVYRESILKGRRIYLDYRTNPAHIKDLDYGILDNEARNYLEQVEACFGTPIDRLIHMNAPAYELYLSKGVDLKKQMLEIRLCAQHCNGGLDVDAWWQTNISHLFAVGEVAGTHGVYRPGGSALNAGQVGAKRAATYIAYYCDSRPTVSQAQFHSIAAAALDTQIAFCKVLSSNTDNASTLALQAATQMSAAAGIVRSPELISKTLESLQSMQSDFSKLVKVSSIEGLLQAYQLRDTLISQCMCLAAMADYAKSTVSSRGSAIYPQKNGTCANTLGESFSFFPDDESKKEQVQLVKWSNGIIEVTWRSVRPLPHDNSVFETAWRNFRQLHEKKCGSA